MPRSARIHAPGHVFHIISRCMNREYLLEGPDAQNRYLGLLAKGLRRTDASVLAWCLMSNMSTSSFGREMTHSGGFSSGCMLDTQYGEIDVAAGWGRCSLIDTRPS